MTDAVWPRTVREYSWQCRITDLVNGTATALVNPDPGTPGAEVIADFDAAVFERPIEIGDLFTMRTWFIQASPGAAEERHESITLIDLGHWTDEEVEHIQAEGKGQWRALNQLIEPAPEPRTCEA